MNALPADLFGGQSTTQEETSWEPIPNKISQDSEHNFEDQNSREAQRLKTNAAALPITVGGVGNSTPG